MHEVQAFGTYPNDIFRYPASLGAAFGPNKACKMQPVIGVELRALRLDAANENYENYTIYRISVWAAGPSTSISISVMIRDGAEQWDTIERSTCKCKLRRCVDESDTKKVKQSLSASQCDTKALRGLLTQV